MDALLMNASTATSSKVLVEKRDGRVVDFDPINIISAVKSAFADLDKQVGPEEEKLIRGFADQIEGEITERYNGPAKIEDIQNLVEHALIDAHLYDVARAYTNYRLDKDIQRAKATDVNEAVSRFINQDPTLIHENANKDANVYATQRDLLAGAVSKAAAFNMLPLLVANAHMKGDIHFHDADYSPFTAQSNCSLPNFWDMLANGFTLGNAPMASPKSIAIAATQITQIMKDVASSQYGGQTANRADEHLAAYAKKDYEKFLEEARETIPDGMPVEFARRQVENAKANEPAKLHFGSREPLPMDTPFHTDVDELEQEREILAKVRTRKSIYDAMQTMEYQINSNRVSNGQTPFVTVGFGLGTDWFAREVQRAILLNRIRGLGKDHHTAIFPKLVFTVRHGVNADPGDPNYDLKQLALECATKRMYPDVVFYENIVKITGSFKAPMGCRSFLQGWINPETGKDEEDGRMNLGVVSVNVPRIAIESHGSKERFWKLFNERMEVAHQALRFRIMRCKQATPVNAPTLFRFGAFGRSPARAATSTRCSRTSAPPCRSATSAWPRPPPSSTARTGSATTAGTPPGQGVRAVDRQAHERTAQAAGARPKATITPCTPHRPQSLTDRFDWPGLRREVRPHRGRHRPRLLHQLLPLPGVAAAHPDGEAQLQRRTSRTFASGGFINYCEYPCLQDNPKRRPGGRVGLRLQHRHRLPRHQHADRPLLRVRLPGRLRADRRGLQVPRVRQLRP